MKKVLVLLLMCFLVFGIMAGSPLVFAKKDSNPGKGSGNKGVNGLSVSNAGNSDTNDDNGDVDDSDDEDQEDGERELGQRKNKTKYKYHDQEGNEVEVETDLEIKEEGEGAGKKLKVKMSDGNNASINITPDEVPRIIKAKVKNVGENYTIELKEKVQKNIPRVVYNVQTNQNGRFLGVFKIALRAEVEIDPETGDIITFSRPWWAFLISIPEEPEEPEEPGNETGNQTNNTAPVITSIPITIVDENASYTYQVTAIDIDNDTLIYLLTQNPVWLSINSSTGLINGTTPFVDNHTNYIVSINVSDEIDFDTQTYNLTVNNTG